MKKLKKLSKKTALLHLVPFLIFCILGATVAMIAGQDQNWDLQNYHYYNAYSLIHNKESKDFAVAGIESYNNPVLDVPSYELITHLRPIIASAILGAIQGINMFLIYEIGIIVLRKFIKGSGLYVLSFIIAGASFFGAGSLGEVGETMGDNLVSILVLLSLLLVFISLFNKQYINTKRGLYLKITAFFIMGVALGLKLTSVPFAIGLLVLELLNYESFPKIIKKYIYDGIALIIGALVSAGWMFYYLFKTYKNPIFPYYNSLFKSPYYPTKNFVDLRWFPHTIAQWIFYPFYFLFHYNFTAEVPFRDPRIALLYCSVVVLAIYAFIKYFRKQPYQKIHKETFALILFITLSFILWEWQFSYYRYLIVLEFLSILAITSVLLTIFKKRAIAIALSILLIGVLLIVTKPMDWGRISWQKTFFGVQLPSGFINQNSTILLVDSNPLGYLVPFFPSNSEFISLNGLSEPFGITTAAQNEINSKIEHQKSLKSSFYGILVDGSVGPETSNFNSYGFNISSCAPIHTYISQLMKDDPNYYLLCKLTT